MPDPSHFFPVLLLILRAGSVRSDTRARHWYSGMIASPVSERSPVGTVALREGVERNPSEGRGIGVALQGLSLNGFGGSLPAT